MRSVQGSWESRNLEGAVRDHFTCEHALDGARKAAPILSKSFVVRV